MAEPHTLLHEISGYIYIYIYKKILIFQLDFYVIQKYHY